MVLPSAQEGVAAVGSCQVMEDVIKVWALIWYLVYFLEAQVLLSTKPGINSIITKSLVFVVSGFPTSGTLWVFQGLISDKIMQHAIG